MRKVFINKWFMLALLLTISLSAFSFIAYKKTVAVCTMTRNCCKTKAEPVKRSEMLWDSFSDQFTSIISIR